MRLPPSVIVMSLVTAGAFALGIRYWSARRDLASSEDREREAMRARYEAEEAELAQREAERRASVEAEDLALFDTLYGKAPAEMGAAFDGIVLGRVAMGLGPDDETKRLEHAFVTYKIDTRSVYAAMAELPIRHDLGGTYDRCHRLAERLTAAWGPKVGLWWKNPTTHQRASLNSEAPCALEFQRYLEPPAWLDEVLLFDVIGKAPDAGLVVAPLTDDVSFATLHGPVLGDELEDTEIRLHIVGGKVVSALAMVRLPDPPMIDAVREALAAKLGAEPWQWKHRIPVRLSYEDGTLAIEIGTLAKR